MFHRHVGYHFEGRNGISFIFLSRATSMAAPNGHWNKVVKWVAEGCVRAYVFHNTVAVQELWYRESPLEYSVTLHSHPFVEMRKWKEFHEVEKVEGKRRRQNEENVDRLLTPPQSAPLRYAKPTFNMPANKPRSPSKVKCEWFLRCWCLGGRFLLVWNTEVGIIFNSL